MNDYDAVVVGAGPNGLAAAVELARNGLSVLVLEAAPTPGGGARTQELTLPRFQHDVCSSVHPLGVSSPFLRTVPLQQLGVSWVDPPVLLAHPLGDGRVALLERALGTTAHSLGDDADAWIRLFQPFVAAAGPLLDDVLAPLRWPPFPLLMARFGWRGLRSAEHLAHGVFRGEAARALFAGIAAHSAAPLSGAGTASIGLVLAIAGHAYGWPFARGGSAAIVNALVEHLGALGGTIQCDTRVRSLAELPRARAVLLDITPRQLLDMAGRTLPAGYRRALERYRYGAGVFKIDWALDGPIPWRDADCARAGTLHLGGTLEQISAAEAAVSRAERPEQPYTIVAQPGAFDPTRAPPGKQVAWAYCHVPNGADWDMSAAIEAQIEHLAPGFRDRILARHRMGPVQLEAHDANLVGGDIAGGAVTLRQLFFRPALRPDPYRVPLKGVYLCSSSTPPGGGVHGMCGYWAARSALKDLGVA
ncbi:MAG TPA: NAD(P)/FAD-dependent oxidoreductase [Longimicrobiales bacterium]